MGEGLGWGHPRVGGTWQWDRAADGLWLPARMGDVGAVEHGGVRGWLAPRPRLRQKSLL